MAISNHPDYYDIANITELLHNFSIAEIPSNVIVQITLAPGQFKIVVISPSLSQTNKSLWNGSVEPPIRTELYAYKNAVGFVKREFTNEEKET